MKDDKRDEHGAETPKDPTQPSGGKPVRPLDEPNPNDPGGGVPEGPGKKP